jgi:hypothetical protein
MSYPVNLETGFSDESALSSKLLMSKIPLSESLPSVPQVPQKLDFNLNASETILTNLKPEYETYENLYASENAKSCLTSLCLEPNELAILRACAKPRVNFPRQVNYN